MFDNTGHKIQTVTKHCSTNDILQQTEHKLGSTLSPTLPT